MPTFLNPAKVVVTDSGGPNPFALVIAAIVVFCAAEAPLILEAITAALITAAITAAVLVIGGVSYLAWKLRHPEVTYSTLEQVTAAAVAARAPRPAVAAPPTRVQLEARRQAAEDALLWALEQLDARHAAEAAQGSYSAEQAPSDRPDLWERPGNVSGRPLRAITQRGDR